MMSDKPIAIASKIEKAGSHSGCRKYMIIYAANVLKANSYHSKANARPEDL